MEWWVIPVALVIATVVTIAFFWLVHSLVRWMLFPGPKPDPQDEMGTAVHEFQVAISEAITPPLERIVRWLASRLETGHRK